MPHTESNYVCKINSRFLNMKFSGNFAKIACNLKDISIFKFKFYFIQKIGSVKGEGKLMFSTTN